MHRKVQYRQSKTESLQLTKRGQKKLSEKGYTSLKMQIDNGAGDQNNKDTVHFLKGANF